MRRALTGGPVDSRQLAATSLPKRYALPLLGSDGISSVAYAADEVILILAVAGAGALTYSPWVGFAIAVVGLVIVGTYRYNIRQVAAEGDFAWYAANWAAARPWCWAPPCCWTTCSR